MLVNFNVFKLNPSSKVNFRSKVVYVSPSVTKFTQEDKDFIDKFEEASEYERTNVLDCKYLGEGVTSKAYYSPTRNFVIKQNKENRFIPPKYRTDMGSLYHENEILHAINERVKTTQRGIAYVETEKKGRFLISTFVSGKPADYISNPMTPKHVDRLLRNLYRLDRSEIIHSDLSRPNLLLTPDKDVNIIDYQWGEKINCKGYNTYIKNSNFPDFEIPNNALMYEMAGLSGYLRRIAKDSPQDARAFMKNYLQIKAYYSAKNARKLDEAYGADCSDQMREKIKFERLKARVYCDPSDKVIDTELLKMDILNLHRRQYSFVDLNKIEPRNVLMSIPLCIRAKGYADELSTIDNKGAKNIDELQYLEYMREYGKHWQKNIRAWYVPSFDWLYRLVSGAESDPAKVYFPDKLDDFEPIDDLSKIRTQNVVYSSLFVKSTSDDIKKASMKKITDDLLKYYEQAHRNGYDHDNARVVGEKVRKILGVQDAD